MSLVAKRLPAKTDAIRMARILDIHCKQSVKLETLEYHMRIVNRLHTELAALDSEMDEELKKP